MLHGNLKKGVLCPEGHMEEGVGVVNEELSEMTEGEFTWPR